MRFVRSLRSSVAMLSNDRIIVTAALTLIVLSVWGIAAVEDWQAAVVGLLATTIALSFVVVFLTVGVER